MAEIITLAQSTSKDEVVTVGFGVRIWAFLRTLVFGRALAVLLASVPKQVRALLSRPGITVADLWRCLPRMAKGSLSRALYNTRGVYLLIGRHISGIWALYAGVSKSVYKRLLCHARVINRLQKGLPVDKKKILFCHKQLSRPGWTVQYHVLSVSDIEDFWMFAYLMESLCMCLLGTVTDTISDCHKAVMVQLVKKLDLNLLTGSQRVEPLNKTLSIEQPIQGKSPASACLLCGTTDEDNMSGGLCQACYMHRRRHGVDKSAAEIQQLVSMRTAKKIAKEDRVCRDCGRTEAELAQTRLSTEYVFWYVDPLNPGEWLHDQCYVKYKDSLPHEGGCTKCGITVATRWYGDKCVDCYREDRQENLTAGGCICRECGEDGSDESVTWWDVTNPAGPLCGSCYGTQRRAAEAAVTTRECRLCHVTVARTWQQLRNKEGPICGDCYTKLRAEKHQNAGHVCRFCGEKVSKDWYDVRHKDGPACGPCHEKSRNRTGRTS